VRGLGDGGAGVGSLGAEEAVELGRMADGLVNLEGDLRAVEDDGRCAGGARGGTEEGERLLRHLWCRLDKGKVPDEFEAGARVLAAVAAGVRPVLGVVVVGRRRRDAGPGLQDGL